jgi:putative alpha-1,2-mannosidase
LGCGIVSVFDEIKIELNQTYYNGKEFKITTINNSKENVYIQKATLNNKSLNTFWFLHDEYQKGGHLVGVFFGKCSCMKYDLLEV